MPNLLDANGLQTATRQELVTFFTVLLKSIYGQDIDLSSDSPDGQLMNLGFVQPTIDIEDLLTQIYNSFDPDNAIGTQLDQRVAINGIQRQAGTYTTTPISITTSQALNLFGLDQTVQPIYTVADNTGNQWELEVSQTIGAPGTYSFQFRAANPGRVLTVPNTINVPVTVVLGVTLINNPAIATSIGINQETDASLRIRRQKSTQLPSQGYLNALEAALGNVTGVTYENVYENLTNAVDADGIPAHAIWAVLGGVGAPADIANAIYVNRTLGCNMKGSQTYNVTQADGTLFTVQWDNVVPQNLYIRFTATSIDGIDPPNIQQILAQLPGIFVPGIGAEVNINQLATYVQQIDPNTLVTIAGFSVNPGGPFTSTLTPTAKNFQFLVSTQNTYIIPIVLLPQTTTAPVTTNVQFTAYGGSQTGYIYSFLVNNSGGSIVAGTGLYTAGVSSGVDTIQVVDSDANTATSTVTVT